MTDSTTNRISTIVISVAIALGAGVWTMGKLEAQQPPFRRVELQRHDLGTPGHEVVLARGEFSPGGAAPKHTHPGEEIAYVLEGDVEIDVDGQPPLKLKAGDSFFVPAGQVHSAKNTGKTPAKILSSYVVEKGKPLATLVK